MKKFLEDLISRKKEEMKKLEARNQSATTVDEVRAIGEQLLSLRDEIINAENQLAALEDDDDGNGGNGGEGGAGEGEGARSFNPLATYRMTPAAGQSRSNDEDPLSSMEYRKAFMTFVQRGEMSDVLKAQMEKRNDDHNTVADLGGVLIPTTVVQEIIKGVEKVYGQLYSRVKKTNVKGGVKYPIGSFSATFRRISETGAPTARQKAGSVTGYVEFTYNIGEIRIATTLLASVLSVPVFEQEIAKTIVEAYVKAMDTEIMTGVAAQNECEGILTEAAKVTSRIPAENIIEFTEADMLDWRSWQTKLFAKIPLSMRALRPEFVMTANTYESNIKTLKDDNNRPIYNETFNPVDGNEKATFKGREVAFVEDDILGNFNDIDVSEESTDSPYFGMYWVPEKAYAINTNLQFSVKRYFDEEKNEWVDKAIVINDGKILDPKYLYLLKKVAAEETA